MSHSQRPQNQPHSEQSSSSKLELPTLKGRLAPAEVTLSQPSPDKTNETSPASPKSFYETIPRDYFHPSHLPHHEMGLKSIDSTANDDMVNHIKKNEHYKYHDHQHQPFQESGKMTEGKIKKSLDSPPGSPTLEYSTITSPFSSTDSLASLVERQNESKINHPSHQIFNTSKRLLSTSSRKPSTSSIFNIFGSTNHNHTNSRNRNNSTPLVRSPLNEKKNPFNTLLSTTASSSSTRRLEPTVSNPHHIHSSPEVKESNHVSLEYDPVSKRKMLNSYEIIKEIGRGEHGKVKLAKDITTEELVAIKIVDRKGKPKLGSSGISGQSTEDKIRKEIAIMKKCSHPNVVKLKEVLDDANSTKIYLVLEYLEKGEIKWRKSLGQPALTLPESLSAFRDVVLGLEYLHYQGIIHRDIKPANLLISADNSVKISDFGVSFASSLKEGETNELDLCKSAGTPAFFAPELCQPIVPGEPEKERPKITHKIDVWALGVTLYCLLFGKLPFWGSNEFELFASINNDELTFPEYFPNNYEWSEEDVFQAKNLLNKMLHKDPSKRIGLKSIKKHPFVLRNLSVEEAKLFTGEQKSCESKILVSNEEVKVAVTGIAGKIKKGFARALKFAGLSGGNSAASSSSSTINKKDSHPSLFKTNTSADLRPNQINKTIRSYSYNLHDPSTRSLSFADDDLERKNSYTKSPLATNSTTATTTNDSSAAQSRQGSRHHKRVRSGDVAGMATSHATVEGDLFLNKSSAFNALSGIMDDDIRRSSVASVSGRSSVSETVPTSNGSSLDNGTQLVSLPMNASFASLDSVYFDNYNGEKTNSISSDERTKPYEGEAEDDSKVSVDEFSNEQSTSKPAHNPRDFFHKMNSFSLNKATEKKVDDSVSPHEPSVTTDELQDTVPGSKDNDTNKRRDSGTRRSNSGARRSDSGNSFRKLRANSSGFSIANNDVNRMNSISTNVSQYSVPSYLANELKASRSITEDNAPDIIVSPSSKSNTPEAADKKTDNLPRRPSLPKRGSTPKYSIFGDSSDESDSSGSFSPATGTRNQSRANTSIDGELNGGEEDDIVVAASGSESEGESDSEEEEEDSEGESNELTLVLGSRRSSRINSIAVGAIDRPNSAPKPSIDTDVKKKPEESATTSNNTNKVKRRLSSLKTSVAGSQIERVSSPLSKNAPKTPIASSNAHMLPAISVNKDEYVNHYKKDHLATPMMKTQGYGGSSTDEKMDDRQRSNSVTVGLLDQKRAHPSTGKFL